MKIYLSPSNQTSNVGAYANTNECFVCEKIADIVAAELMKCEGVEINTAPRSYDLKSRCMEAAAWGADIYISIHTNGSSDKSVRGTETFYKHGDILGQNIALALLNDVGLVSGKKRRANGNRSDLIEVNTPTMPHAIIEVDFHSNPDAAYELQTHPDVFAIAIANALISELNLIPKTITESETETEKTISHYTVSFTLTPEQIEALKILIPGIEVIEHGNS